MVLLNWAAHVTTLPFIYLFFHSTIYFPPIPFIHHLFIHPSCCPCVITIPLYGITNLRCESVVNLRASCCSADPRRERLKRCTWQGMLQGHIWWASPVVMLHCFTPAWPTEMYGLSKQHQPPHPQASAVLRRNEPTQQMPAIRHLLWLPVMCSLCRYAALLTHRGPHLLMEKAGRPSERRSH